MTLTEVATKRPSGATEEIAFYAQQAKAVASRERPPIEPFTRYDIPQEQTDILEGALYGFIDDIDLFLEQRFDDNPTLHGLSRRELLREYVVAELSRNKSIIERTTNLAGDMPFFVHDTGEEHLFLALERHLTNSDSVAYHYRNSTGDIYRGGKIRDIYRQDFQKNGDPHTGGIQLASHVASNERSEYPVTSYVPGHFLPGASIGSALGHRHRTGKLEEPWARFEKPDSIAVVHGGDAGMAQGEASETLQEMVNKPGNRTLLVIHHNGGGISTDTAEGMPAGDPIIMARGMKEKGLLEIIEVDATNLQELFDKARDAIVHVRGGKPVVLMPYNLAKLHNHTSSDRFHEYHTPKEVAAMMSNDPLPRLRSYLVEQGVSDLDTLNRIREMCEKFTTAELQVVRAEADPDVKDNYKYVYRGAHFGPKKLDADPGDFLSEVDILESSREEGVEYVQKKPFCVAAGVPITTEHYRTDTPPLSLRHAITTTLWEEMAKDDRILLWGEDSAALSVSKIRAMPDYVWSHIQHLRKDVKKFEPFAHHVEEIMEAAELVSQGRGREANPIMLGYIAEIAGEKSSVFKITSGLQYGFGADRVWNSQLAEAGNVGRLTGYGVAGYTPIVELPFGSYLGPAYHQLTVQLATLSRRSNNQFSAGGVFLVEDMNYLKGIGADGHGNVFTSKYMVPGLRLVFPSHASEAGPLLRESIRIAREHGQPVIYGIPINMLNSYEVEGHHQGTNTHIPLGEAEVQYLGLEGTTPESSDILVLTYSNVCPKVQKAAVEWRKRGVNATMVNLRSLGPETDWDRIGSLYKQCGKVMVVEGERMVSAGAGLVAQLMENFYTYSDAPPKHLHARGYQTPAGAKNEEYSLPQEEDIIREGIKLAAF